MNIISNIKSVITPTVQQTEYIVGSDLLDNLHKIEVLAKNEVSCFLILSDETVFKLYGRQVSRSLKNFKKDIVVSTIAAGEKSKDLRLLPKIIKPFFQKGFDRNACLISLGGGVVTDIGGFLASILLRGIANINIPTTLLGQVDAAIGGKSGVDFWLSDKAMYKNMIGTIREPLLVISDIETLKTLPGKEILNGLGEIVKYWIGWGKPTLHQLLAIKTPERLKHLAGGRMDSCQVEELVKTISICQRIKIDVVTKDPFEQSGERQKLNLGHTIGHAIEGTGNGKLSHGEAVSIGLIAAAKISLLMKMLSLVKYKQIVATVKSLGLPINIQGINMESVLSALHYDKKDGAFVLIRDIGKIETNYRVPEKYIRLALKEVIL